ncbi:MAG: hypothetical protein MH472_08525 [Bacteroidia bacterium]|nr:hypothetical protein [Bacteroidia bacterium]
MNVFSIENLKSHWGFIKVFKVALALMVLVQAYIASELFLAIFALFFMGQALLNVGCGSPAGCGVPVNKSLQNTENDITFTEVNPLKNEK